jgi:ppGpp synthetase/RelA/SpoT-type nucleotidyltranferase
LIVIPILAGPPALLGLGLHALTGQRLSRPLLLLALLAIAAWWGITNGQTFLTPDYVTAHTPQDGSRIPRLVPFDAVMLGLLAAPETFGRWCMGDAGVGNKVDHQLEADLLPNKILCNINTICKTANPKRGYRVRGMKIVEKEKYSKSKIDKAGSILSQADREYDETTLEMEYVFEDYRRYHLEPLTKLTLEIQQWLQTYDKKYYIAQRLKRRPQILRKLRRLSVRLTQLQDIGGCRIILEKNSDVDDTIGFIRDKIINSKLAKISRETDYRELGRDDTGYRAFHMILDVEGFKIELQIRSRIQHYWSESIERTSVIYGFRLKEKEGDQSVIDYFKQFSHALHEIEISRRISSDMEINLQEKREIAEKIILHSADSQSLSGHVNSDIVKTMSEKEGLYTENLNNWILVFDWNDGNFVTWDVVGRNAVEAIEAYSRYETDFPEEEKYEVVLIGTSDIKTVTHTHSHYFGIEHHNDALEGMENSIIGLAKRSELDIGARRILFTMKRRKYWGKNTINIATLRNHFCQNAATFDASLADLVGRGLITGDDPISLDIKKSGVINSYT